MMQTRVTQALIALVVVACGRSDDKPSTQDRPGTPGPTSATVPGPVNNLTPNDLIARGAPTIVVGTLGDDKADRAIAAQARMVRDLFAGATIVPDTSIDVAAGPSGWPANPLLYGGAHVNAVVAALGDALPLRIDAERIVVGGETYAGPGMRVITVVPPGEAPGVPALRGHRHDRLVAEINALRHGARRS